MTKLNRIQGKEIVITWVAAQVYATTQIPCSHSLYGYGFEQKQIVNIDLC